jgi:hypothetical protein
MMNLFKIICVGFCLLATSLVNAAIIEYSQNSNVSTGAKVYLPTTASGFPTPFQITANVPPPQTYFDLDDDIRVASQYSLQDIVEDDLLLFGNPDELDWSYVFVPWADNTIEIWGSTSYSWTDILADQLQGFVALNFASDDYFLNSGLMTDGYWNVYTYIEGVFVSQTSFKVVEPGTMALFAFGVLFVGRRKFKQIYCP